MSITWKVIMSRTFDRQRRTSSKKVSPDRGVCSLQEGHQRGAIALPCGYDHRRYLSGDHPCSACAVASSAGKKHSRASSERVTSIGVPNTVVVLRKLSFPASVTSWKGTNTPAVSSRGMSYSCARILSSRPNGSLAKNRSTPQGSRAGPYTMGKPERRRHCRLPHTSPEPTFRSRLQLRR